MNNSYNYADFVGMNIKSTEAMDTENYQNEAIQANAYTDDTSIETRIENMLLNHSKYYIYCE